MIYPIACVLGAFFYRLRGGAASLIFPNCGTQVARLCWCIPTAIMLGYMADDPLLALVAMPVLFLGLLLPHAFAQNGDAIGTVGMSIITLARTMLVVLLAWLLLRVVWFPAIGTALFAGPAYWLAYRIPSTIPQAERGCELGEALTGALIWIGYVLSTTM